MSKQKRILKQITAIVCAAMFMFSMSLFASTDASTGLEVAEIKRGHEIEVKNRKDEWDTNDKGELCVRQCILPATYNCTYIDGLSINC